METTKDSIDWSHVHERFKWMARDKNGAAYLYDSAPEISPHWMWVHRSDQCALTSSFSSYKRGTCGWKDSLVERPKASEK